MGDTRVVSWADFRGGEAGTIHGLGIAPPNSFTGRNVVVYRDGAIGPRGGLQDRTPTGQANGLIHALGITNVPGNEFWYAQGTSVYQFQDTAGARSAAYTGAAMVAPSKASDVFDNRYIIVPGDKAYRLDHVAKTVTSLGSPAGRCIAVFGSRVFIGASGNNNRIRYSADADDTSWTISTATGAPGQFDVGNNLETPGDEIRGLYPFRDFLLIVKAKGELWVLTANGDPTTTGTLRRVSPRESGGAIFQPNRGKVTYGNEYWAIGIHSTAPQMFSGGRLQEIARLGTESAAAFTETGPWSGSMLQTDVLPPEYAVAGISQDSLLAVGNNRGLLKRDGIWTKHEFGVTVVGYVADGTFGGALLTDGGAAGAVPHFYWMNTSDDQPPVKGSGIKLRDSVGDGSDTAPACDFTLPVVRDPEGRRFMVREVIVNFRKYATGVAATNHFDCDVVAEYGYDNNAELTSTVQSFDEAAASGSAVGRRRQVAFYFGDQGYSSSAQIEFTNLRGVSIDSVRAVIIAEPAPL